MALLKQIAMGPAVQLVGDVSHPGFRDAIELLRAEAQIVSTANALPELIVVAQCRPGSIDRRTVETLQRSAPLAGMIALVGTWCEGEQRTGKPWPGVERLYWYEFSSWWRRQLAIRASGRCPDWARPGDFRFRISDFGFRIAADQSLGLVTIRAARRETANVLIDVLRRAGYATVWQPLGRSVLAIQGAIAGVWDGGQLNGREADDLSLFCRRLTSDRAPVIAMLDFPRRDRVDRALEIGAAAVLGKPWLNTDLLAALQTLIIQANRARAA